MDPQPNDSLDTWAFCSSRVSLQKASNVKAKKHILKRSRRAEAQASRKMLRIMAESKRIRLRGMLRECTSISLAVDEMDTKKVVRIRFDTPCRPYTHDDVLGVLSKSFGSKNGVVCDVKEDTAEFSLHLLDFF